MTRFVGHRVHGHIEVYGYAQSIPEALALEDALRNVPRGDAFQAEQRPIPEAPEDHPALADAEDTTEGLNCETRAVAP